MSLRTVINSACALALAALACLSSACFIAPRAGSSKAGGAATTSVPRRALDFDEYMRADFTPADGFDFPFGDGESGGSYTKPAPGKGHTGWDGASQF